MIMHYLLVSIPPEPFEPADAEQRTGNAHCLARFLLRCILFLGFDFFCQSQPSMHGEATGWCLAATWLLAPTRMTF
jgi:hypothetical protein